MFSLEELFCCVDDFCQAFEPQWERQLLGKGLQRLRRPRRLCLSEIMTILIGFHQSCYRNFKAYYQELVQCHKQVCFSRVSQLWAVCPCGCRVRCCPCALLCVLALATVAASALWIPRA